MDTIREIAPLHAIATTFVHVHSGASGNDHFKFPVVGIDIKKKSLIAMSLNNVSGSRNSRVTLTTRVSYPIAGELFPVHFNIHASFPFFASSKLQLNLHFHQVTISLKTAAYSSKIFTIVSRACPHRFINVGII